MFLQIIGWLVFVFLAGLFTVQGALGWLALHGLTGKTHARPVIVMLIGIALAVVAFYIAPFSISFTGKS